MNLSHTVLPIYNQKINVAMPHCVRDVSRSKVVPDVSPMNNPRRMSDRPGYNRCQPEMRDQSLACRIPLIRRRVPRMLASIGQHDSSWNEPATRPLTTSIEIVAVVHVVFAGSRLRGWWNGTVWLQGDAKLLDHSTEWFHLKSNVFICVSIIIIIIIREMLEI